MTPDDIEVLHGDTLITPLGMDTYGSRSVSVGGVALHFAMEKIKAKARTIAAHELEVSEDDLEWARRLVPRDRRARQGEDDPRARVLARGTRTRSPEGTEPHLNATAIYDPPNFTWPAGAHVCVVEVDTETGATDIVKYVAVDDCGTVINPMIVEGQIHGGVAQGIAEALYEEAIYDESGNLTTSTMTQYLVPTAVEIPTITTDGTHQTPSTTNPLGVKGIGEAGHDRGAAGGDQRGDRRRLAPRRDGRSEAGVARARLASHPGRSERRCGMIPAAFEYERADSVDARDRSCCRPTTARSCSPAATRSCR